MADIEYNLGGTVWRLFLDANNYRETCGGAHDLRSSTARLMLATQNEVGERAETELPDGMGRPEPWCSCDRETGESCDACEPILPEVCTINEAMAWCKKHDPFDGLAHKLTTVKVGDFTAAANSYYAPVGNKPARLKANPVADVPDEELVTAASVLFDYIQKFLDDNQVTVDEIPEAFNLGSINDLVDNLERTARERLEQEIQEGLHKAEDHMSVVFNRARLMNEYLKMLDDITHSPIGVMWYDPDYLSTTFKAGSKGLRTSYELLPTARRVEPQRAWFTPDWKKDKCGRAVFTTRQLTKGDLLRIRQHVPDKLKPNISELVEEHQFGYRMYSTQLFFDTMTADDGLYDVLICRGTFLNEELEEVGVKLPSGLDDMQQAEVWYANGMVVHAKILPKYIENLGVYTTNFRNMGESIWGVSLYDFVNPFAKLYEGAIRAVDTSVAKSAGSIISLDVGVIEEPESILQRNTDGTYSLDLSGDTIIKFDSSDAMISPNWRGVPIQIDQLPSDLNEMVPAIALALEQMELISGIPSIISSGTPNSSAVRTNDSYRTAYRSASKQIASLLKNSKENTLIPLLVSFYRTLVDDGLLSHMAKDIYPELLLDERLAGDIESAQASGAALEAVIPFVDRISDETLNGLLNRYMRSVYDLDFDVAPGSNPIGGATPAQQTGSI